MAVANFGPRFIWELNQSLTLVAILVNLVIGFGMIMANKRQLKGLDELQQKIQLEAMGLSLGVGLVVGLAYSNLDVTKLIASDAEISHLVILTLTTWALYPSSLGRFKASPCRAALEGLPPSLLKLRHFQ